VIKHVVMRRYFDTLLIGIPPHNHMLYHPKILHFSDRRINHSECGIQPAAGIAAILMVPAILAGPAIPAGLAIPAGQSKLAGLALLTKIPSISNMFPRAPSGHIF